MTKVKKFRRPREKRFRTFSSGKNLTGESRDLPQPNRDERQTLSLASLVLLLHQDPSNSFSLGIIHQILSFYALKIDLRNTCDRTASFLKSMITTAVRTPKKTKLAKTHVRKEDLQISSLNNDIAVQTSSET